MGWAARAQAEEGWFHLYIFKPHYFKTFLIAEEVVVCMLEQEMLLNLGHTDMNFEVLYAVDNSYCDRKCGITKCDNIVCETFRFAFFCLTDFPVVFGDETGDDITKAPIGNTAIIEVYD